MSTTRWEGADPPPRGRAGPVVAALAAVAVVALLLRGTGAPEDPAALPGGLPVLPSDPAAPATPDGTESLETGRSDGAGPEGGGPGGGGFDGDTGDPPPPAVVEEAGGAWEQLAPAPVPAAASAEAAWTGAELVVVGGDGSSAAFHARDRRWRTLAPYPGPVADGAHVHGLVWTGTEVLALARSPDRRLAVQPVHALDVAAGTWRRLPDGPFPIASPAVTAWTGSELLVWGRPGGAGPEGEPAVGAAWSETGGWRVLAPAPQPHIADAAGVLTGAGLVVWGRLAVGARDVTGTDTYAARLDPGTGEWTALRPPPLADPAGAAAAWTGTCGPDGQPACDRLVLWGSRHRADGSGTDTAVGGAMLDLRLDRWLALPAAPTRASAVPGAALTEGTATGGIAAGATVTGVAGAWTGGRLLVVGGSPEPVALALESGGRRWRTLPPMPPRRDPAVVWTGEELLVWGGVGPDGPSTELIVWRPPR